MRSFFKFAREQLRRGSYRGGTGSGDGDSDEEKERASEKENTVRTHGPAQSSKEEGETQEGRTARTQHQPRPHGRGSGRR